VENISSALLDWFYKNHRILPFRTDPSPYHVWLSEIMLQQTRVSAALPYFERFMAELPTVADLAACDPERLHKLWEGLGYYSRVRNLQKAAQIVMEQHGGALPADYDALLKLPGVGAYTAGAIASISFGLPCRSYLNTTFLTMAMYAGLDLAIMNPSSEEMMAAVYAYNVLTNRDPQSTKYIERYADHVPASVALKQAAQTVPAASASASGESAELTGPYAPLMKAVEKGLKGDAAAQTKALLAEKQPLEVVDEALIPALDIVGAKYEKGTLFLPQLLQAASAAQSAFEEIKNVIAQKGEGSASKGRIVLATVKGDVHDIGKNIVKVILENYGFEVIDLGRDVPVETVVNTVREKNVHLVGLSALMTTTLKSMEETIAALHEAGLDCKIMVGGAVLTPEYAEKIGADWYAKDAKRSADIAKEFFGAQ